MYCHDRTGYYRALDHGSFKRIHTSYTFLYLCNYCHIHIFLFSRPILRKSNSNAEKIETAFLMQLKTVIFSLKSKIRVESSSRTEIQYMTKVRITFQLGFNSLFLQCKIQIISIVFCYSIALILLVYCETTL